MDKDYKHNGTHMPTPEEIEKIVGEEEKQGEETSSIVEEAPLATEEYRKALDRGASYEELRKLHSKQDTELYELRQKVKEYESKDKFEEKVEEEEIPLEDKILSKIEERVEKKLRGELSLQERALKIRSDVQEAMKKYPFVKEAEIVNFIGEIGNISVKQALKLKYEEEIKAYEKSQSELEVSETDSGGRTIAVRSNLIPENKAPLKRSFGRSIADRISDSLDRNAKNAAGIR